MKQLRILLLSFLTTFSLFAQEMGSWKTYFAYNNVSEIVQTKDKIFALSSGVLFSVDTEYESIETYTKIDGLSDGYISHIAYNQTNDALIITYDNSNIDILKNNTISNISDLKRKDVKGKQVNAIATDKEYAYLACGLGIIVVDLNKNEIADTYIIGDNGDYLEVTNIEIIGDSIYALTDTDLRCAPSKGKNLADFSNWTSRNYVSSTIKKITQFNNRLVIADNDSISIQMDTCFRSILPIQDFRFISGTNSDLVVADGSIIRRYNANLQLSDSMKVDYCKYAIYSPKSGEYWMSKSENYKDSIYSIHKLFKIKDGQVVNKFQPNGPQSSSVAFIRYENGALLCGSGGPHDLPNFNVSGVFQIYQDNQWTVLNESNWDNSGLLHLGTRFVDVLDAITDPTDPKRIYIATWRSLFEVYDKKPFKQYWLDEAPFEPVGTDMVLLNGLCFDKDNNLWMTNMLSNKGLVVKKADGTWDSFNYTGINNNGTIKETFFSENGFLWVICPRLAATLGVLVVDQKGTPFDQTDDQYKFFSTFKDQDGNVNSFNAIRCIAEDKNNAVWIGTGAGPLIVNNPNDIFDTDYRFERIKITREDDENYADYLLSSDQINAIIVDGGNRKWLGSATSGVYLLSADGKETLQHFTTDNSPMTSNAVIDMTMNHETGELFIATANGLFSYMSDVTEGAANYDSIYVYPNPVTPDFDGKITVNGLIENSLVRIADVSGNLIYENYSNGGTFTWDGKDLGGNRVATGIYYIFAALEDGSMKMVSKLAFIH